MNLNVIYTEHLEQTRRFYEAIGLEFTEKKHGTGSLHYSCTLNDGLVLEIYPRHQSSDVRLGFEVSNLHAVLEALGRPRMTELPDKMVAVRDPDNRTVYLSERR